MSTISLVASRVVRRGDVAGAPPPPGATGPVPASPIVTSAAPGGAGVASLAWTAVTTKEDTSALPSGEVSHYNVRRYNSVANGGALQATTNVGNVTSASPSGISAGTYDFTVSCVSTYGEGEESLKYAITVS